MVWTHRAKLKVTSLRNVTECVDYPTIRLFWDQGYGNKIVSKTPENKLFQRIKTRFLSI